ncbi:MAG: sensor histidine kinase N-terminal domain-containing protein [Jannaschia sp.]
MRNEVRLPSLRARLLGLMTLGFIALLMLILMLLWGYARDAANRSYDLLLAGAALSILERTSLGPDGPVVDIPITAFEILGFAADDRVVYAVRSETSGLLTGMSDLPVARTAAPDEPSFFDAERDGETMRFVRQSRQIATSTGRDRIAVQIGQTRDARNAQARAMFLNGAVGLAALSLIGLCFVWLAVTRALRPLQAIERDLSARAPDDLSPLIVSPPREVSGLTQAIDDFMSRLAASRAQVERFIADVAHQSRTSMSTLQGEIALAVDAKDAATMRRRLIRAEEAVARGVHLNEQLLSHAMVIHRAEGQRMNPLALSDLVRKFLSDTMRRTDMAPHAMTFDAEDVEAGADRIAGDPVALREALRNLIDNAVRHGPPANTIGVAVTATPPGYVTLSVEDVGPGIPTTARGSALERFSSVDRPGGTGLGLPIVKAVADAHGATLTLADAPTGGLRVALRFARVTVAAAAVLLVAPQVRADPLVIWSATDTDAMAPIVSAFEDANPTARVEYREFVTSELYAALLAPSATMPDVVVSSAMDLQVDLVNRGLARRLSVTPAADWAVWRSELFGFTWEPVATLYDRRVLSPDVLPSSHADLARFIRDNEARLLGRIGTYDIRSSGVGYLFATQDANRGQQFLRIAEAAGRTGIRVHCCTSDMIAEIASGRLHLAINVIGSYAMAAQARHPNLGVHFFDDYNLVMTRSMFVPRAARDGALGERFVRFVLSDAGQDRIETQSSLRPILGGSLAGSIGVPDGSAFPIRLGLPLLTYLDRAKQAAFIEAWEEAIQSGLIPG